MKPFSLLIKPACADCNLRCTYCFYLDHSRLYPATPRHRMSDAVLERTISSYMATEQPQYAFGWQGGEPTLMGVDFFRRVTDLQRQKGKPGSSVANGLQTNATLIDDDFALHLARYNFLVGVSLDGPAGIHDRNRLTADGRPSHAQVLKGVEHLRRHDVQFNILTLVNAANAKHARHIYRYLRDQGFFHHQYIPCVEFDAYGGLQPFAISGEEWGAFLCELFDEWVTADTRKMSIRTFDSILARLVDGVANVCYMGQNCCQYFVVEHNGDVYPCDFFVEPPLKLGNIMDNSWDELLASPVYEAFGRQKSAWNAACAKCRFLELCAGDCPKHRLAGGQDAERLSSLCTGWKMFFDHSLDTFNRIAGEIRRERAEHQRKSEQLIASAFKFAIAENQNGQ